MPYYAGRVVVDKYAQNPTALDLILPAVAGSIMAENWRIRQSSLLLMGKLLFKVGQLCICVIIAL